MNDKTLNALDGSSVLAEVMADKIEAQRKSYKRAIKNAVVRNDHTHEAVDKANARAEKNQAKLDALVEGGMEGFLSNGADDEDESVLGIMPKKTYRPSSRYSDGGNL